MAKQKIYISVENEKIVRAKKDCPFANSIEIESDLAIEDIVGCTFNSVSKTLTQSISSLLDKKTKELEDEANYRIQTIPPDIRSKILQREKTSPKTYKDTWQNFYQKCQNLRFDADIVHETDARKAATWVVERITFVSERKHTLKYALKSMTVDELELFDPSNDRHWQAQGEKS